MSNQITPFIATHPGEVLKDELIARNLKQKDFAVEISMQPTMLNEIINAKRSLTADIAILLEKSLEIDADFWMQFQMQYDIDSARIKEKNIKRLQNIEQWSVIKQYVPFKYYYKHGILTKNIDADIDKVKEVYQVKNIAELIDAFGEYKTYAPTYYKKSTKLQVDEVNLFGWSKLVMYLSYKETAKQFELSNIPELIEKLHAIFHENIEVRSKTKSLLSEYGIKLIFLEKFDRTPVDGFSFWSIDNPCIGLTLRHKRIDNFAFTIFHEIGHIVKHLQNNRSIQFIDLDRKGYRIKSDKENEADKFAQANLITDEQWRNISAYPIFKEERIIQFGTIYKINPAIILGRICYEKNDYAVKTNIDRQIH